MGMLNTVRAAARAAAASVAIVSGGVLGVVPAWGAVPAGGAAPGQGIASQARSAEAPQLRALDVPAAWKTSTGYGVTVAVLDTGVDHNVPDLSGSVAFGPDFTKGVDPPGYQPPHLHGTFIASLIAGHGSGAGHGEGVIGVAPAARVLSVRVILDDQEPGLAAYNQDPAYHRVIGHGIRYAVDHGAGVINMSLGGPTSSRDTRAAIGYAISRGVVVVAAAGNDGSGGRRYAPYSYPASYTGVISVAALTTRGARAWFSQRNSSVVISAPGVRIVGAGPGGSYLEADGTSPASAFVAGVAALIRSRYPGLTPAQVEEALVTSTRRRPAAGYDPGTGFGEVDAAAALRAARRLAATRPAAGMPAAQFFGTGQRGPFEVVHRDKGRIAVGYGVAGSAGVAFLVALGLLGVLTRRGVRERRARQLGPWPAGPEPGWPAMAPPPWGPPAPPAATPPPVWGPAAPPPVWGPAAPPPAAAPPPVWGPAAPPPAAAPPPVWGPAAPPPAAAPPVWRPAAPPSADTPSPWAPPDA
jgi:type VII secretion-associated serine protease mycosin